MQNQNEIEEEIPKGVILRDFDDFSTLRNQIFDGVKNAMSKAFPVKYGNVRMELHDVDYDELDDVPISNQKKQLLENKYITKKLRGTIKLLDNTNDELIEEKRISLMRVPYLTNRGTFIHGGNEYASIMQSRLLPGVYTRRQANGELETQFNVKPGTGIGFRVGFEPETTQYRVKISQANLHLYSLLKDTGTDDKELEKAWGPDILKANQARYDARVFDKAYERLVPARQKKLDSTREDKINSLKSAFEAAQIHARVAQKNLPNMFDPKVASEWEARWQGKQAMEKLASENIDSIPFEPDLTPKEAAETFIDEDVLADIENEKSAADMRALMQARRHSSQAKDEYKKKTAIMAAALARYPDEFIVDQDGRMSGITHMPTGFRIHVPREVIPKNVKRVFQEVEDDE
jgi:DNA-directed RNA polymerase beta subunit